MTIPDPCPPPAPSRPTPAPPGTASPHSTAGPSPASTGPSPGAAPSPSTAGSSPASTRPPSGAAPSPSAAGPSSPSPAPSPERVRLASALRDVRGRTSLSLAGLAAKTTFSKSSWERYLNGRTLPPRAAVEELCGLAGEPDGRCLALWELAESECRGRAAPIRARPRTAPPPAPPPPPPPPDQPARLSGPAERPPGHRGAVVLAVLASVSAVVVAAVAVALFLCLPRPDDPGAVAERGAPGPLCRGSACAGRDPVRMDCARAPATLARHRTAGGAWVELRYSTACGASWARMWGTRIGDRLEMTPGGRASVVGDRADTDAYVHTPMSATRAGTVVRACLTSGRGGLADCVESRVRPQAPAPSDPA